MYTEFWSYTNSPWWKDLRYVEMVMTWSENIRRDSNVISNTSAFIHNRTMSTKLFETINDILKLMNKMVISAWTWELANGMRAPKIYGSWRWLEMKLWWFSYHLMRAHIDCYETSRVPMQGKKKAQWTMSLASSILTLVS